MHAIRLFVLCLWMVLWGCGGLQPAAAGERSMADILVSQADTDQERHAVRGQRVLIRLPENPATGYQWQIEFFDPQVLKASGSDFSPPAEGRLGAGGLRTFYFTALSPGRSMVRLFYRRPWETTSEAAQSFSIAILVQMKAQP